MSRRGLRGGSGERVARVAAVALLALAVIGAGSIQASPAATSMSGDEVASLRYARQQEKLARDVYRALERRWSMSVFRTLARSHGQGMVAVKALLTRYRIADPVAGRGEGRFADPAFSRLYRNSVRQGQWSRWDARSVGVRIESREMRELRARLLSAAHPDVRRLLTQLRQASSSHLRALEHSEGEGEHGSDHGDGTGGD